MFSETSSWEEMSATVGINQVILFLLERYLSWVNIALNPQNYAKLIESFYPRNCVLVSPLDKQVI